MPGFCMSASLHQSRRMYCTYLLHCPRSIAVYIYGAGRFGGRFSRGAARHSQAEQV
jgi:hypothetical protein